MVDEITQTCAGMLIIREGDGKVLLVRSNKDGRWGMPFGKGEPGESALQTAIREAREETGIEVTHARVIYENPLRDGMAATTFLALEYTGEPKSSAEGEVRWCNISLLLGTDGRFWQYNNVMMGVLLDTFWGMCIREDAWDPKD